jgi:hypothetical protein
MEAVREITVWEGISRQPNHIYLLDGDRVVAYRKWGEGPVEWLSGKVKIDRRGRKFEKADIGLFNVEEQKKDPAILAVPGSKGATYLVNTEEKSCSCPGFTFRGSCKHIKELAVEEH